MAINCETVSAKTMAPTKMTSIVTSKSLESTGVYRPYPIVRVQDIDLKNAVRYRSENAKNIKCAIVFYVFPTFGSFMQIIGVVPIKVYVYFQYSINKKSALHLNS